MSVSAYAGVVVWVSVCVDVCAVVRHVVGVIVGPVVSVGLRVVCCVALTRPHNKHRRGASIAHPSSAGEAHMNTQIPIRAYSGQTLVPE